MIDVHHWIFFLFLFLFFLGAINYLFRLVGDDDGGGGGGRKKKWNKIYGWQ